MSKEDGQPASLAQFLSIFPEERRKRCWMCAIYAVNYDLRVKGGPDYQGLFEELKNSFGWWHFLESTWLIISNETAEGLWQRISPHVHERDSVLIVEVKNNSAGWLPKEAWDWINKNFPALAA